MSLRNPWWLLLLLPVLAWLVFSLAKAPMGRFSPLKRLQSGKAGWRGRLWWLPEILLGLALAAGVLLLAGPERELVPGSEDANGLAIAIGFDRSTSMSAVIPFMDKEMSRIEAVKAVTRDFIKQRPNDQFALVSFARYPETNAPLTGNHAVITDLLELLAVPTRPEEDGTAIGDALVLATARLKHLGNKPGLIILLTDGQNNQGEKQPAEAAAIAKQAGIPVYCIALGGDGYLPLDGPNGTAYRSVAESIDEATLAAIAKATGGRSYHALKPEDLAGFYQDIAQRETQKLSLSRPPLRELALDPGLWTLLGLLIASWLARHALLRRMDP